MVEKGKLNNDIQILISLDLDYSYWRYLVLLPAVVVVAVAHKKGEMMKHNMENGCAYEIETVRYKFYATANSIEISDGLMTFSMNGVPTIILPLDDVKYVRIDEE